MANRKSIQVGNLMVIEFDAHEPPKFVEKKNKDWVLLGEDNKYDRYLKELVLRSPKHGAIINGKVKYIVGKGLEIAEKEIDAKVEGKTKTFLAEINPDESAIEVHKKICTDCETYGGYYIQLIPAKKSGRVYAYHLDFSCMRVSKDEKTFYYCEDWTVAKPESHESFQVLPLFDPKKNIGVIYFKKYRPGLRHYPLPGYVAAVPYAELDWEIANFHLNNIKNGAYIDKIFNFNNGISDETKQAVIEKKLKEKSTGSKNAGKVLVSFNESKENATTVDNLRASDNDKLFELVEKTVEQNLFTGHEVTSPMLFGVKSEGQLSGRTELVAAYELFKNTYAQPEQMQYEELFSFLSGLNGGAPVKIVQLEPVIEQLSEAELVKVMTPDEIRARGGLDPLPIEKKPKESKVLNALNIMSPLVATKVLERLTVNEIRNLAGLDPLQDGDAIPAAIPAAMGKQTPKVETFSQFGEPNGNFVVLKRKPAMIRNYFGAIIEENAMLMEFATVVDGNINDFDAKVLRAIQKNPLSSAEEIAKALKVDKDKIEKAFKTLHERGLIETKQPKDSPAERIPTDRGKDVINEEPKGTQIFIMYEYVKRPGVDGPTILPTTRDLCRELLALDRKFSRADIEKISQMEGYDVFERTGGFWNDGGETKDHCRHMWEMQIVRRK